MIAIEGHRHIVSGLGQFPVRDDCFGARADDRNFIRLCNIREHAIASAVDIKRLGMGCNRNVCNHAEVIGINYSDFGRISCVRSAVADKKLVIGLIVDHVVRIV